MIMPRLFGTNGVRGRVNEEMTSELALRLGKATGTVFGKGSYVVGMDTRVSNQMLKTAFISGVLSGGGDVTDAGIVPSPTLQYSVRYLGARAGAMITASHNPPQFNGIKIIQGDGTEAERDIEEKIEDIIHRDACTVASWDAIGETRVMDIRKRYRDAVCSQVNESMIREKKFLVIMDCGNGAGCRVMPYLLRDLGCRVVSVNCHPDGMFPGRLPEPTCDSLSDLMGMVCASKADMGVALDGDADRAVFVDENGGYIDGDKTLALMASHLVSPGTTCVTPVSSSSCVSDVVTKKGGEMVFTRVGAPLVARKMIEVSAVFGGEENGGLIFPRHQYCRDGGMAMAAVLDIMAGTGEPLSHLVGELPSYSLFRGKVPCPPDKKEKILRDLVKGEDHEVNLTDGVKILLPEGWVLVRPSGTESLIRVYAEAKDPGTAEKMGDRYIRMVQRMLG